MLSCYTLPSIYVNMILQGKKRREVIYADIHVVTAESRTFETILDDDRVEYAKLNHTNNNLSPKKDEATSDNYSNLVLNL